MWSSLKLFSPRLKAPSAKPAPPRVVGSVSVGERAVPLLMRRSRRARALTLNIDPVEDAVELVLPRGVSLDEGLRFAQSKSGWLLTRLALRPPRVPFASGQMIPFLGSDHVIEHRPESRGGVWREDGCICVTGHEEFLARRVRDWLKGQAQQILAARSHAKAAVIDRQIARVSLRDPKTRWGSCGPNGVISYSWRLVLTPESVLDYVVAHEVAHLVHNNHGIRFWRLVDKLTPQAEPSRDWLRRHGERLLRYG